MKRRALAFRWVCLAAAGASCGWPDSERSEPEVFWTVEPGSSLSSIARKHGVTVEALREANGLSSNLIHPGDRLRIPQGSAEVQPSQRRSTRPPSTTRSERPTPSHLPPLPKPQPCLPPPDPADLEEGQAAASLGLTAAQAANATQQVLPHTVHCVPDGDSPPPGTLMVQLQVGCDGRVKRATATTDPGWPTEVRDCVIALLERAPFPAHALPDGDQVLQPVRW